MPATLSQALSRLPERTPSNAGGSECATAQDHRLGHARLRHRQAHTWPLGGLDGEWALDYREVRIVLVTDEGFVTTPWGDFTVDSLPPQGLLSVSDDG